LFVKYTIEDKGNIIKNKIMLKICSGGGTGTGVPSPYTFSKENENMLALENNG
jgi:hypothetical protein